jgi:hypothetical protein
MYIFHFNGKKIIKLEDEHILCTWSKVISRNKEEKNIYLTTTTSEEFKMLIRIMELIMRSKNESEFVQLIKILSQMCDMGMLKKSLLLMHQLEIVPPKGLIILTKIPSSGGSLANVIGPIFAEIHRTQNIILGKNKIPTINENIQLMLYNQNSLIVNDNKEE